MRKQKRVKSVYMLVCEGRNKTERKFFNRFSSQDSSIALHIKDCESTGIQNMADKAARLWCSEDLSKERGDKIFCLIDLDLDEKKYAEYKRIRSKSEYSNVDFIVSNPCFEVWLQYYFTDHPKKVASSQKAKEEMRKYV